MNLQLEDLIQVSLKPEISEIYSLPVALTAQAARSRHHAWPGGLIDHITEMWLIYKAIPFYKPPSSINFEAKVATVILLHDVHKIFHKQSQKHPLIHNAEIINNYNIDLSYIEWEAILASEGGYSEIIVNDQNPLTKLCYCLDELSANFYKGALTSK